jgi:hypothetical protein
MTRFETRRIVSRALTAALVLTASLATLPARGQAPEAAKKPETEMRIFRLAHADAQDTAIVLEQFVNEGRLAVDQRTNSVLVSASPDVLSVVEAVIRNLDDRPTQEKPAQLAARPVQVRLVWLVSGLKEQRSAPGKDLEPVVAELVQLGIADPRVVANALINVHGGDFTLLGTPRLAPDWPVRLELAGRLEWGQADHPALRVDLAVRADQGGPSGAKDAQGPPRNLLNLASTIDAPYGQFVVLGAAPLAELASVSAPLGELTSVFVLQVVPK